MKKLVLLLFALPCLCLAQTGKPLVIHNMRIVDVEKGKIIENQALKVSNGKIERIAPLKKLKTRRCQIIDGRGKYLIPGKTLTKTRR